MIQIRLSIVAYRDFGDRDQFEIFDFSSNVDDCTKFLKYLSCEGGDDVPEDVAGAFENALK